MPLEIKVKMQPNITAFFGKKEVEAKKASNKRSRTASAASNDKRTAKSAVNSSALKKEHIADSVEVIDLSDDGNDVKPKPKSRLSKKTRINIEESNDDDDEDAHPPIKRAKYTHSKIQKVQAINQPDLSTSNQVSAINAGDILNSIPDTELPENIISKPYSFWQKKTDVPAGSDPDFKRPLGKPDCLAGLTIVFTGLLPHLNREECELLVNEYGGRVTKSVSRKTSLVVIGEDAGASKIKKIKELGIRHIDEAGFVKLIEGMPEAGGSNNEAAEKMLLKRKQQEMEAQKEAQIEIEKAEKAEKLRKIRTANSDYVRPVDRPDTEKLWTVKYAPQEVKQICGNKGQVQKITKWLNNWESNKRSKFKYFGESFPAVLISGPPGIGKTTAAHVIAKSLGYDIIEKNASDVRSKSLLNATVRDLLDNSSIVGFFQKKEQRKVCLIMDEVDGMSSGDIGGIGALSSFCRHTSIPIILICNDKSLPKMRPFDRVTLDASFRRPTATEVKSRIMTISHREKLNVPPIIIDRLVEYTKNDIRQIINLLSTVSKTVKTINEGNYKQVINNWEKNVAVKTFDLAGRILSSLIWSSNSTATLNDKLQYYFEDFSIAPLMVHENYRNVIPSKAHGDPLEHLKLVSKAADSISEADLIDKKIHSSEQLWSLMPSHGIMSFVRPASFVNGQISGRIGFTSLLGNMSRANKFTRLLTDLNYHSFLSTHSNKREFRLNYSNVLSMKLVDPLIKEGNSGIDDVINVLDDYYLTKEDWEYLLSLNIGSSKYLFEDVNKELPTAVKSQFTRKYNNSSHPVAIHHVGVAGVSKKAISTAKPDLEDAFEEDDVLIGDDDDDIVDDSDISKDKSIKQKKQKAPAKKKPAARTKRARTK